jgi:hypothetical protein
VSVPQTPPPPLAGETMHLSEQEIHGTLARPRFHEAGAPAFTPDVVEALEDAFRGWWGKNSRDMHDGATGDVVQLFFVLNAAFANASTSSAFAPKARS